MGKRGPAKTPTQVAILHGYRKDRINHTEPRPAEIEIKAPAWLDASSRTVWRNLAPDLVRKGVLTGWDLEAFACWCDAVTRRRRAVKALRAEGEIISVPVYNKNGDQTGERLTRNPWLLVMRDADAQVQRIGARFGLTPSDRADLSIGEADRDPDEDLLTG
ncbi:phage terminase small subunit P27 family [Spirillospora sp. NBC_00431]